MTSWDERARRRAAQGWVLAAATLLGAAACSSGKVESGTPATTASTAGSSSPGSSSPGSSAPGSSTAGSSSSTVSETPAPAGGGRMYSDPDEQIVADIGDEFVVKLPKPSNEWVRDKDCINAKTLDQKTQSDGSVLFRLQMDVSGACHLDFFDGTADAGGDAEGDLRFDVVDPDLAD